VIHLPVLRWGQPYNSLEVDEVVHFSTGEPIAKVDRANGGLIQRDMRKAQQARDALTRIPIDELIAMAGRAGELYMNGTLPMGDGTQTADEFVHAQSASTGLPEHMCRANMKKNGFVLAEMRNILTALTRGLDLNVLTRGYGEERGVPISYQAQSPVLGLVLPSNSPGCAPKYQSVLEIIAQGTANLQRSRYITFALAARGQRNADTPYAAMFPGLFTEGLDRAASYMFRGIVADSVRGLTWLLTRRELDTTRVLVVGNDMALITAALAPGVTHVV
jgi:hypothetical protein